MHEVSYHKGGMTYFTLTGTYEDFCRSWNGTEYPLLEEQVYRYVVSLCTRGCDGGWIG